MTRRDKACRDGAWNGRRGAAGQDAAWRFAARRHGTRHGRHDEAAHDPMRLDVNAARADKARQARLGETRHGVAR